jgi:hypothetical protein
MSTLPLEVIEMFGQTIAKVVPITIVLALVFSVLSYFWACNPAAPWLLVLRASDHARGPDRTAGDRRRRGLQYP